MTAQLTCLLYPHHALHTSRLLFHSTAKSIKAQYPQLQPRFSLTHLRQGPISQGNVFDQYRREIMRLASSQISKLLFKHWWHPGWDDVFWYCVEFRQIQNRTSLTQRGFAIPSHVRITVTSDRSASQHHNARMGGSTRDLKAICIERRTSWLLLMWMLMTLNTQLEDSRLHTLPNLLISVHHSFIPAPRLLRRWHAAQRS